MKHRAQQLVILGVLFLSMAILALWQSAPRQIAQPTVSPTIDPRLTNRIFSGWSASDIQALRLDDTTSDLDLLLNRTETGWETGDSTIAIDQTIAEAIAQTLAILPYEAVIANVSTDEYVNYGLENDRIWLQIQVILQSGSGHVIGIGGRVPTDGGGWYAVVDNFPEVYILNKGAVDFLAIYLQEWQSIERN